MEAEPIQVRRLAVHVIMTTTKPHVCTSEIIALAWADDVSFDKIKRDTGLTEREVILVMRGHMKPRSFELWRARVSGRKAKHERKSRLRVIPDAGDL